MESESKYPYSQHSPPNPVYPPTASTPGSNQFYPPPASAPGYPVSDPGYPPQYTPPYPNAPDYNYENNPAYYQPPNYIPNNNVPPPGAYYPNSGYPNPPYNNSVPYSSGVPVQIKITNSKTPTQVFCHQCNLNVTSEVLKRPGTTAWLTCLVLCCFCFPLCLYPLICDPCLDTYHMCPRCRTVMSVKSP